MFKFEENNNHDFKKEEVKNEEIVIENVDEMITVDSKNDEVKTEEKNEIKFEEKFDKKVKKENDIKKEEIVNSKVAVNQIFVSDDSNLRRSALFNAESDLYRVKFDEYAGIPDCIVNQIFGINDGKGKITIEEAIIMLMNLMPSAKAGINEAKTIQDAIYISRIKIAAFLYKECTFGFTNIPEHSRVNFSNKIKADCDKNLVFDVLYDYQLMRLSGFLPLG